METNVIYNMDCLQFMRTLPDKCIDLCLTDPPYGIGEDGGKNHNRGSLQDAEKFKGSKNTTGAGIESTKFTIKKWDKEKPSKEIFDEILRISKNQVIFGGNYFLEYLRNTSCFIVWDKLNGTTDFADCELAWTSFTTAVRKFSYMWNGMLQGDMRFKEKRVHPTQKPVRLGEWILEKYAKDGDIIFDPFAGSGTFLVSAQNLGFKFLGCELDPDYFSIAEKRLEFVKQRLF